MDRARETLMILITSRYCGICKYEYDPAKESHTDHNIETQGTKHDQGKVDLTYITPEWMALHCSIREFGSKKYSRNNWMLGFKILRSLAAAMRHIVAFTWGEDNDPESGLNHLGHASNCLEHAYHDFLYRKVNDDRVKATCNVSGVFTGMAGDSGDKK